MHCDMGQRCIIVGCRISFLLEHGIRTPRVLFAIQAQSRLICGHVLRSEYYARADKVAVFLSMVRRVYCSSAALKGVYHTPDVSSVRVCVCVCVCVSVSVCPFVCRSFLFVYRNLPPPVHTSRFFTPYPPSNLQIGPYVFERNFFNENSGPNWPVCF